MQLLGAGVQCTFETVARGEATRTRVLPFNRPGLIARAVARSSTYFSRALGVYARAQWLTRALSSALVMSDGDGMEGEAEGVGQAGSG